MANTTQTIELLMPTVSIQLEREGMGYGFGWIELPFVPAPGDTLDADHETWTVLRRHVDVDRFAPESSSISVIVEPKDKTR